MLSQMLSFAVFTVLLFPGFRIQAAAPMTPNELANAALIHFNIANQESTHYAFVQDREISIDNGSGKQTQKHILHYEEVFIDGARYVRSYQSDGQQHTAEETEESNHEWTEYARDNVFFEKPDTVPRRNHIPNLIAKVFENRIAGHEVILGHDCIILDSRPLSMLKDPEAQNDIRLWIDSVSLNVLRISWNSLIDIQPYSPKGVAIGNKALKGNNSTIDFLIVNGTPLPSQVIDDGRYRSKSGQVLRIRVADHYSNYQRFTTKVIIIPPNPS
jgi:hypothetical protein